MFVCPCCPVFLVNELIFIRMGNARTGVPFVGLAFLFPLAALRCRFFIIAVVTGIVLGLAAAKQLFLPSRIADWRGMVAILLVLLLALTTLKWVIEYEDCFS